MAIYFQGSLRGYIFRDLGSKHKLGGWVGSRDLMGKYFREMASKVIFLVYIYYFY